MTLSELKSHIRNEILKLYEKHIEENGMIDEDFGEMASYSDCMNQPEVCMSAPETILDPRPEL